MSVIRRIQIGENHKSAEVLNRPTDDIQTLSGLTPGATFTGFANKAVVDSILTGSGYLATGSGFPGFARLGESNVLTLAAGSLINNGVLDAGPAFRAAMTAIAALGGGTVRVPSGRYSFVITGDSDSIRLPSNCNILCDAGSVFEWSYMGSPLFVAVNQENILFDQPTFEWKGTLVDVPGGNVNRFGWTGTTAGNADMCAHVLGLGTSGLKVRRARIRTKGDAPTVATQACFVGLGFFPKADDSTRVRDNGVEDSAIDDAVIGVLTVGQDNFSFRNIVSRRFPGAHPVSGSLNGHLLYMSSAGVGMSSYGSVIDNIVDHGASYGTITSRGDATIQIRMQERAVVKGVTSHRPTGCVNLFNVRYSDITATWAPATVETNGFTSGVDHTYSLEDSVLKLNIILPDSTDKAAWNFSGMQRCKIDAYISASHSATSIPSSVFTTCLDNTVVLDYLARNSSTALALNFFSGSLRNTLDLRPVGQNHQVRPFVSTGCTDNVIRIRDNLIGQWSSLSHWTTESDSPTIGFESLKKTKAYRIGTTTNPTTTIQLPRPGIYLVSCQIIEASGAHLRGGYYLIAYDAGSMQSVQLIGSAWTVGASAPSAMSLAVSAAGVITVTSTAGSFAWDMVYDIASAGNNRYADY